MSDLLGRLRADSVVHITQSSSEGFAILPRGDRLAEFSALVREAINDASGDFVVFPSLVPGTTEGFYERAHVIPLD